MEIILVNQNKIVRLPEETKKEEINEYIYSGYDLVDESLNVLKRAQGGREIPLNMHNSLLDKYDKALQENADLKEENEVLSNENIRLDGIIKQLKLKAKGDELNVK